ncbi:MAG: hypothetical protein ACREP9_00575, partial [Candidatus Dormibacteraceae bacterium]
QGASGSLRLAERARALRSLAVHHHGTEDERLEWQEREDSPAQPPPLDALKRLHVLRLDEVTQRQALADAMAEELTTSNAHSELGQSRGKSTPLPGRVVPLSSLGELEE